MRCSVTQSFSPLNPDPYSVLITILFAFTYLKNENTVYFVILVRLTKIYQDFSTPVTLLVFVFSIKKKRRGY